MPNVNNPPALIAQETGAWCFAAAEQMVRAYYGLEARNQYQIARRIAAARAELDPQFQETWQLAQALDASMEQTENGGANLASQVVQLVRTQWGAFDHDATHGHFEANLTAEIVKREIDANRIFVLGAEIHYYVVYGYSDDGKTMLVRDPWPAGTGGMRATVSLATFNGWNGHTAILFG
jgi:hypothetical protein